MEGNNILMIRCTTHTARPQNGIKVSDPLPEDSEWEITITDLEERVQQTYRMFLWRINNSNQMQIPIDN